jgi:hypothetical protein
MKWKSWGVLWSPDIYHALDHECACGAELVGSSSNHLKALAPLLVGFSTDAPLRSNEYFTHVGAAIFECDVCHEKFWFHLSEVGAQIFKGYIPRWPKK